jgi:hypothetical protein
MYEKPSSVTGTESEFVRPNGDKRPDQPDQLGQRDIRLSVGGGYEYYEHTKNGSPMCSVYDVEECI